MTRQAIIQLLIDNDLTLTDVIDAVIEVNGFIGVGLITLGDQIQQYIYHHKKMSKAHPQYGNYGEIGIVPIVKDNQVATNPYGGELVDPHTLR